MKKTLMVITLTHTLLLAACAPQNFQNQMKEGPSAAIVGGDRVETSSLVGRSTVGIYESKIGYICSGTLIGRNLVLTAAHCVDPKAKNLAVIFSPEMRKARRNQIRPVTQWMVHPEYSGNVQAKDMSDIAVLRFDGEAPAGFEPAPLLLDRNYLRNGQRTIVAGYGLNWTIGIHRGAGTLRTTRLPMDDVNFSETEVLLGQSIRRGICSGDSGGPAYLEVQGRLYVWGVASRGDSIPLLLVPDCMLFSVFTRVSSHQVFLQNAINTLSRN